MVHHQGEQLLDRIYEAAIVPSGWPEVLSDIATLLNGVGGFLFTAGHHRTEWLASPALAGRFSNFVEAGWVSKNSRVARATQREIVGFTVSDLDLFSRDEIEQDPMYAYLRAHGLGWFAGSTMEVPSGDMLVMNVERAFDMGPFEPELVAFLESLRPHIARAALLAARLGLRQAREAAETLALIGLPAGVISRTQRLVASNSLFDELLPSVVLDCRDRVRLVDPRADAMLVESLRRIAHGTRVADTFSLPLAARVNRPAMAVHMVPIRRTANDIFCEASCLLVATPVARKVAPPAGLIQGLFDLTAAEARVTRAIVAGESLTALAGRSGVTASTVRGQLKSVFAKTGVSRQSDLVALLTGISL